MESSASASGHSIRSNPVRHIDARWVIETGGSAKMTRTVSKDEMDGSVGAAYVKDCNEPWTEL